MHSVGSHTGMGSVILSTFVADTLKPSVWTAGLMSLHNAQCSMERLGETV